MLNGQSSSLNGHEPDSQNSRSANSTSEKTNKWHTRARARALLESGKLNRKKRGGIMMPPLNLILASKQYCNPRRYNWPEFKIWYNY
jgi:hypothetical protein